MTDITEQWKTAIVDGKPYEDYKVSNLGKILSLNYKNTGKAELMNPVTNTNGYFQVNLYKNGESKTCRVHRLVAEAFLENPENLPEVNHKDENKKNNFVFLNEDGTVNKKRSNLEWKTHKDNINHGTRNERAAKANTNGKLSKKVLQLSLTGELICEYPSIRECGRNGFDHGAVCRCCNGKQKTHKGFRFMYK